MAENTVYSLSGKKILITGAAGRVGSAIARSALEAGATVVLADIASERLQRMEVDLLSSFEGRVHTVVADVTTQVGISALLEWSINAVDTLTSAVHSAYPTSAGWGTSFEKLDASFLHEDLANQLGGAILFSQQILSHFSKNSGGDLVHISSIQGICAPKFEHYLGTTMTSPIEYAAIKAGVISITRWLAKYYSNQNVRVNCVSPGGVLDAQPVEFLQRYRDSCTNIGMLSATQVASAVVFLLSEAAEAVNGQNLVVDDGWSL
jgi:NAD(P)-dependent dehydrogenase (short-subunit alcohol dehydrogenase family)